MRGPARRPQARAVARGAAAPAPAVRGPAERAPAVLGPAASRVTPAGLGARREPAQEGSVARCQGPEALAVWRGRARVATAARWRAQAARAAAQDKWEARRAGAAARPPLLAAPRGASVGPAVRPREAAERAKPGPGRAEILRRPTPTETPLRVARAARMKAAVIARRASQSCSWLPSARGGGDGDVHVTSVVNPADRDRRAQFR